MAPPTNKTLLSAADVFTYIMGRGFEDSTDTVGDFYSLAVQAMVEAWDEVVMFHPWLDLVKDPPGAFLTVANLTTTTIIIAAAGTNVAGTLSVAPTASILGYKIIPSGKGYAIRVTAHTAGSITVTLDAAPDAFTTAQACTILQDEYTLASDLGVFVDGLWDQSTGGALVRLVSEESLKAMFSAVPGPGTSTHFCRLTPTKIRLSHSPTAVRRFEYPYCYQPSPPTDPTSTTTLVLPTYVIAAFAEKALAVLLETKFDKRQASVEKRALVLLEEAVIYETRRKVGIGMLAGRIDRGYYNEVPRHGGHGA